MDPAVNIAVLTVGRGGGKSTLSAGLALGALLGAWDKQPQREILIGARNQDQAAIAWKYAAGLAKSLPDEIQKDLVFRKAPRLSIEYKGDGGGHIIKPVPAVGASVLGTSPNFAILDERAAWADGAGEDLEEAILSGLGKRAGKAVIISTSAASDAHPLSRWLDEEQEGVYRQEHRPEPGLPADDLESLLIANPGAAEGIGSSVEWLQMAARRAIARGGSALASFRNLNRNERVSTETRGLLLTADEWLGCETDQLPPREGPVVVGIDLGGSASMTACAFFWPVSGRLEALGAFPSQPSLLMRGQNDAVSDRYVEMHRRGELRTMGERTVPIADFMVEALRRIEGEQISAICADRFKNSEMAEGLDRAQIRAPVVWRGFGWKDGSEDIERFRRAVFDGKVKANPSLLLRSAFADAVTLVDPAGNAKLAKGRAMGRIDAAAASVIAVAEGMRQVGRPVKQARAALWV